MTTWFIADTHFGHTAILQYEDRPFTSVEEMDGALIANWNWVVQDDDEVYHLGDVALVPKPRIIEVLARLKGRKHLVCGNHDRRITCTWWRDHGFETVVKFPGTLAIRMPGVGSFNGELLLSHVPVPDTTMLNVHGHMHANKHRAMPTGDPALYRCVSVEQTGYAPISLEEVLR